MTSISEPEQTTYAEEGPETSREHSRATVTCPNCSSRYRLPEPPENGEVCAFHCHRCDTRFQMSWGALAPPDTAAAPPSEPQREETVDDNGAEPQPAPAETETGEESAPPPPIVPTMTDFADDTHATSPPPAAPTLRLWPWLLTLLLLIAALGLWINSDAWARSQLIESVRAWWAPQRSIGWQIRRGEPQWITREGAKPLLAIAIHLHNGVLFDRPPPPLLLTTHSDHAEDDTHLIVLHRQPTLAQLEQPNWQPPSEDHTPIPAGGGRDYLVVLDQPPTTLRSVEIALH